ncbi:MAG: MFS transporter [Dermatophilaceae bacterium]
MSAAKDAAKSVGRGLKATGRATLRGSKAGARLVGQGTKSGTRKFREFAAADGARETGLARLTELHLVATAADAAFTIALASTVLALPVGQARGQVALFLLTTMVPFVFLSPLIGPILDRYRHGRRWAIGATLAVRAFLSWVLAGLIMSGSAWILPVALVCLVATRAYAVTTAAAVPRVVPDGVTLVKANSRQSIAALMGMVLGSAVSGLAGRVGAEWSLRVAFGIYVVATILAITLPAQVDTRPVLIVDVDDPDGMDDPEAVDDPGRHSEAVAAAEAGLGSAGEWGNAGEWGDDPAYRSWQEQRSGLGTERGEAPSRGGDPAYPQGGEAPGRGGDPAYPRAGAAAPGRGGDPAYRPSRRGGIPRRGGREPAEAVAAVAAAADFAPDPGSRGTGRNERITSSGRVFDVVRGVPHERAAAGGRLGCVRARGGCRGGGAGQRGRRVCRQPDRASIAFGRRDRDARAFDGTRPHHCRFVFAGDSCPVGVGNGCLRPVGPPVSGCPGAG